MIGVISDSPTNLTKFLKSFLDLYKKYDNFVKNYCIFVLENTQNEYKIRPIVHYFAHKKHLNLKLISNKNKTTIAASRTKLQHFIYKNATKKYKENFVSWIIDDDLVFEFAQELPNYFEAINAIKAKNIDAIFGLNSDCAPLPFLSTIRTQMLDFYYHLSYFANSKPNETCNLPKNETKDEFYYDLSSNNFAHLEYPYFLSFENQNNKNALKDLLRQTSQIAKGVNVFRKISFEKTHWLGGYKPSIYRGGNTIIYTPNLLKTPNYTPKNTVYNRRSDFNWAIINKALGYKTAQIVMPLKHDRTSEKTSINLNKEKLKADIIGMIFYRLLEKLLQNKKSKAPLAYYHKTKKILLTKLKLNNLRTIYLINACLSLLENKKLWWYNNEHRKNLHEEIIENILTLKTLKTELEKRDFQDLLIALEKEKINQDLIETISKETSQILQKLNNKRLC